MKYNFYVGSYTEMITSDFGGCGDGIYLMSFDTLTRKIELKYTTKVLNPAYITIAPDGKFLYAITEVVKEKNPLVQAYSVGEHGVLEYLNSQKVEGSLPCHINNLDKSILVACYATGNVFQFTVTEEGLINNRTTSFQHIGKSVNEDRQEGPHAHQVVIHPNRKDVFVPDLGMDTIKAYSFEHGDLKQNPKNDIVIPEGFGPRHLVFNEAGDLGYCMNELNGYVSVLKYDNDTFEYLASYNSLPEKFNGLPSGAAIRLHPNGKYLYVSNRTIDAITVFKIDDDKLELLDITYASGKTVREFNITPNGEWLLACMQDSNELIAYSIGANGKLKEELKNNEINSPVCLVFSPF